MMKIESLCFLWLIVITAEKIQAQESYADQAEEELILEVFNEPEDNEPSSEYKALASPATKKLDLLVEPFTAHTLRRREAKLGLEFEYGLTDHISAGSDLPSALIGIPTFFTKWNFHQGYENKFALGLNMAFFNLDTIAPWAPVQELFDRLEANIVKPAFVWTHMLSKRLYLHTYWTVGFGEINAELSDEGKRKIWEQKHPGGDYDARNTTAPRRLPDESSGERTARNSTNIERSGSETSNVTRRALEMQSLFGLSTDQFQITGEYVRRGGHKILVTSRVERLVLEDLKARTFRLTLSQQWVKDSFQFRLGLGALYLAITGKDFDGEQVDETMIVPVSDFSFYWRI